MVLTMLIPAHAAGDVGLFRPPRDRRHPAHVDFHGYEGMVMRSCS